MPESSDGAVIAMHGSSSTDSGRSERMPATAESGQEPPSTFGIPPANFCRARPSRLTEAAHVGGRHRFHYQDCVGQSSLRQPCQAHPMGEPSEIIWSIGPNPILECGDA